MVVGLKRLSLHSQRLYAFMTWPSKDWYQSIFVDGCGTLNICSCSTQGPCWGLLCFLILRTWDNWLSTWQSASTCSCNFGAARWANRWGYAASGLRWPRTDKDADLTNNAAATLRTEPASCATWRHFWKNAPTWTCNMNSNMSMNNIWIQLLSSCKPCVWKHYECICLLRDVFDHSREPSTLGAAPGHGQFLNTSSSTLWFCLGKKPLCHLSLQTGPRRVCSTVVSNSISPMPCVKAWAQGHNTKNIEKPQIFSQESLLASLTSSMQALQPANVMRWRGAMLSSTASLAPCISWSRKLGPSACHWSCFHDFRICRSWVAHLEMFPSNLYQISPLHFLHAS